MLGPNQGATVGIVLGGLLLGDAEFIRFLRSYLKTIGGQQSSTTHVPMII